MMDDITFVWLTFHNDAPCCVQSVGSILDLGADPGRCWVAETRGKEIRDEERRALTDMGVRIRKSRFTRSETYADLVNVLDVCSEAAREDRARWVYQLDSDVIVERMDPVAGAIEAGAVAMAGSAEGCRFAGCSWLCRTDALECIRRDVKTVNTLKIPGRTTSDVPCGSLLDHFYGRDKVVRHLNNRDAGGYLRSWHYGFDEAPMEDLLRWDVIHFGSRKFVRAGGRPIRDVVAETMAGFRQFLLRQS